MCRRRTAPLRSASSRAWRPLDGPAKMDTRLDPCECVKVRRRNGVPTDGNSDSHRLILRTQSDNTDRICSAAQAFASDVTLGILDCIQTTAGAIVCSYHTIFRLPPSSQPVPPLPCLSGRRDPPTKPSFLDGASSSPPSRPRRLLSTPPLPVNRRSPQSAYAQVSPNW